MPQATATIEAAGSLSDAVDLHAGGGYTAGFDPAATGVITPAEWETQAITFQVSADGETFVDLRRVAADGSHAELSIVAAAASQAYPLTTDDFRGFRYLKVRSGTSASPAAQTDECVVVIVTKDF